MTLMKTISSKYFLRTMHATYVSHSALSSVIWDMRLLPVKCNLAMRSYQTGMTPHQSKKISFREAAKFFTTYISRDMSRKLCEAFIAIADRHKDGVFNGDCIYLSLQMARALGNRVSCKGCATRAVTGYSPFRFCQDRHVRNHQR